MVAESFCIEFSSQTKLEIVIIKGDGLQTYNDKILSQVLTESFLAFIITNNVQIVYK